VAGWLVTGMPDQPAPASGPGDGGAGDTFADLLKLTNERTKRFQDATEKIRQRADISGKALAGLATTAITAIGIAKFSDVFPMPPDANKWVAIPFLLGGFTLMAVSVALFAKRLFDVGQPIITQADLGIMEFTDDRDRQIFASVYGRTATLNDVESLRAYQSRAIRFERIAEHADEEAADELRRRAILINSEVSQTMARAAVAVVRRRASNALSDGRAIFLVSLFFVSFAAFAVSADYLDSLRSGKVAVLKACGEAVTAGADRQALPKICASPSPSVSPSPTVTPPRVITAAAVEALASKLADCEQSVASGIGSRQDCDPIRAAISDLSGLSGTP
jgi:hypothetical protein